MNAPQPPTGDPIASDPSEYLQEFRTASLIAQGSNKARELLDDPEIALKGFDPITESWIKASPMFFATHILRGPNEPPYFGSILVGKHHLEWDGLVTKHKRLCVLAPRDHGKSGFFSFTYPLWRAINNPGEKGYIFSATQEQAILLLHQIKEEIEGNPYLRHLKPANPTRWSGKWIQLTNGHSLFARGYLSRVRGAHPQYIIVDDGLNDETLWSPKQREKQINYFLSAITNMITPGGQILVVGTPFSSSDLYAHLAKNKQYTFRRYAALDKYGNALWPERYSRQDLENKREEITPIRFAREFLCQPVSDAASLFPSELFTGDHIERYDLRMGMRTDEYSDAIGTPITVFMGVDLAISTTVGADYMVIFAIGVDKDGNKWIMHLERHQGLAYHLQLQAIKRVARRVDPALILIESNQMQQVYTDELKRTTDLPIQGYHTGKEKHGVEQGIASLRLLFENNKVRIPMGNEATREIMEVWQTEMTAMTYLDGKIQSTSDHDDTVMAFWLAINAEKAANFKFWFDEEGANEPGDPYQDNEQDTDETDDDNDDVFGLGNVY